MLDLIFIAQFFVLSAPPVRERELVAEECITVAWDDALVFVVAVGAT